MIFHTFYLQLIIWNTLHGDESVIYLLPHITHLAPPPYLSHGGVISFVAVQLLLKHLGQNCTVFVFPEPKHTHTHKNTHITQTHYIDPAFYPEYKTFIDRLMYRQKQEVEYQIQEQAR